MGHLDQTDVARLGQQASITLTNWCNRLAAALRGDRTGKRNPYDHDGRYGGTEGKGPRAHRC